MTFPTVENFCFCMSLETGRSIITSYTGVWVILPATNYSVFIEKDIVWFVLFIIIGVIFSIVCILFQVPAIRQALPNAKKEFFEFFVLFAIINVIFAVMLMLLDLLLGIIYFVFFRPLDIYFIIVLYSYWHEEQE